MRNFAEMNEHEQKMLDVWMEYWAECNDGCFDDRDDDFDFPAWLVEEAEWYASECGEAFAEPYRQALAEWQA